jgi:hypothetical protein
MICDIFTYVSFTSLFFCLESTALFLPHTTPGHPRHAACIFPLFLGKKPDETMMGNAVLREIGVRTV